MTQIKISQVSGLSTKVLPAGGTTGQVPAKASNTDGDIAWVNQSGGGGSSAYTSRTFNQVLTFDANFKMETTQTADITFSVSGSPVADVIARIIVTGDGHHSVTFPGTWTNANGQIFDNQQKNVIYLEYDGTEVLYSIVKVVIPDIILPFILSASIENTAKNKVVLQYSEPLDTGSVPANSAFSANLSKAISTVAISGSQVTVTMSTDYANGDVPTISYTPGGNPIRDIAHNNAVALVNYAVTNNVDPAKQTASISTFNQRLITSVIPTNLAWFTGSGTDKPISVSFWIKRNNTSAEFIFDLGTLSSSTPDSGLYMTAVGNVQWVFNGSGGGLDAQGSSNIPANIWTHVVLTYSGNGLYSGMKIYFNNSLQVTSNAGSGSYTPPTAFVSDNRLAVFGRPSTGYTNFLNASALSSLYFWNRELSTGEINLLYNGGQLIDPTTLSYASDLLARYDLNGNSNDAGPSTYNLGSVTPPTYAFDTP